MGPNTQRQSQRWSRSDCIALFAAAISLSAFFLSIWSLWSPGYICPIRPSGYAIIREVNPFPSDHIILPLEWENTSGRPIVVRQIYLRLCELDPIGQKTGREVRFPLAGEYPNISDESFQRIYNFVNSFTLEPKSITFKMLAFHHENFWDNSSNMHRFRFLAGENYKVYIGYHKNLEPQTEMDLFDMPIYDEVNKLDRGTEHFWNYFYLR